MSTGIYFDTMQLVKDLASALVHLLYPHVCAGCGSDKIDTDTSLCWYCLQELPATGFAGHPHNPVEKLLWARIRFYAAHAGFFLNRHSLMEQLIHQLKYKHKRALGEQLGSLLGAQLKESGRFEADALVPVPLHPKKLKQRGYNQAAVICSGMAKELKIPLVENLLTRQQFSRSQTRLGRVGRWENSHSTFSIRFADRLAHQRILLVDDVLTTGATLESCFRQLDEIPGVRISIATVCLSSL